ncbi:hypothetical protein LNV09_20685 [Paucibacter sp. B2R-40]|uniref:hypothetical protein n=1 Tax=Paucibacter sp. B2R-40 TaxID=2893554 RepID=UPI0021E4AED5|nr:hypothetical protein [Paucibacter sp. B2R-40]MCV2356565.1 hypothetical protein [Paucibacter sp. B2R-40]
MLLRRQDGWAPVYEALNLDWIDRGCGADTEFRLPQKEIVRRLKERAREDFF